MDEQEDDFEIDKGIWCYVVGTLVVWGLGLAAAFIICYGMVQ